MIHFYKTLNEVYPNTSDEIREILDRLDEAATKDEEVSDDRIDALLVEIDALEYEKHILEENIADLRFEVRTRYLLGHTRLMSNKD